MLRAALAFFVLALIAIVFGATGVAGVSMEVGRLLLVVFLILAIISFVVSMFSGRGPRIAPLRGIFAKPGDHERKSRRDCAPANSVGGARSARRSRSRLCSSENNADAFGRYAGLGHWHSARFEQ